MDFITLVNCYSISISASRHYSIAIIVCLVNICQIQRNKLELLKDAQTCLPRPKPKIQKIQTEIYNIQIYLSNRTNDKYTQKNSLRILKFF